MTYDPNCVKCRYSRPGMPGHEEHAPEDMFPGCLTCAEVETSHESSGDCRDC